MEKLIYRILGALLALLFLVTPAPAAGPWLAQDVLAPIGVQGPYLSQGEEEGVLPWQQSQAPPLELAQVVTNPSVTGICPPIGQSVTGVSTQVGACGYRAQLTAVLSDGATVADYEPGNYTGTLNASAWLNSIGAAPSLAQASGAAQPIILPFDGQKYAYQPGVVGNVFTTPSASANQITGDIDIRAYLARNDWTTTSVAGVLTKIVTAGQYAYDVAFNSGGGGIGFRYSTDGTTLVFAGSSVSPSTVFSSGQAGWIRVTRTAATGAVIFYTSLDGISWTQLGTTIAGASGSMYAGTSTIQVGAAAGSFLLGKIYRAQIYNGINGTLVADFNASDWPETTKNGATAVSSTTGETWTLANTGALLAQIVGSPQLLFDGAAMFMQMATTLVQPSVAIAVFNEITAVNSATILDGLTTGSGRLTEDDTPRIRATAGTFFGLQATTLNTYQIVSVAFNGASPASWLQINNGAAVTGSSGAANMAGLTLGVAGGATAFSNIQVKEVIILNAVPSAAKLAKIVALLNQINGGTIYVADATPFLGSPYWRTAANDDHYRIAANQ